MASYEETFCQAMQLIAENAVKNAGYDKTIQATIISCEDKTTGCYKVQYQDNIFLAYSADTKVKYTKGNLVYILIPNSNFDNNSFKCFCNQKQLSNFNYRENETIWNACKYWSH